MSTFFIKAAVELLALLTATSELGSSFSSSLPSSFSSPFPSELFPPSELFHPAAELNAFSFRKLASATSVLRPKQELLLSNLSAFAANHPALALGLVALALVFIGLLIRWLLGRADEAAQPDLEREVSRFEAIKAYRQRYGVSLKDAREAIMKLPPKLLGLVSKSEGGREQSSPESAQSSAESEGEEPQL